MKKILVFLTVLTAVMIVTGCSGKSDAKQAGSDNFNVNVTVSDENGKPVSGVRVQACDDSVCTTAMTDDNGHASFNMSTSAVDVHILKTPEGFSFDSEATFTPDEKGSLAITLKSE